jgi:hypothetical protein
VNPLNRKEIAWTTWYAGVREGLQARPDVRGWDQKKLRAWFEPVFDHWYLQEALSKTQIATGEHDG